MTAHEVPDDSVLDRDPLAARLARIQDPPVPAALVARIAARAHARPAAPAGPPLAGTRGIRRPGGWTAALVAAVLAVTVAITATTTPLHTYVSDLLTQMGLQPASHDLAVVSGDGQRIRVTSGLDDGWTVILGIRAEPGVWRESSREWVIRVLTVTDATGRLLENQGWQGNETDGGDEVLAFFRRPPGGAPAGSPLTLHVQPGGDGVADSRPGWTLRFTVTASPEPRTVTAPAPGRVGDVDIAFTEVRASDRYVVIVVDAVGGDEVAIMQTVGPTQLVDPAGRHVPNMHGAGRPLERTPSGLHDHEELYWPRQGSGTYRVIVGPRDGKHLERTFVVP